MKTPEQIADEIITERKEASYFNARDSMIAAIEADRAQRERGNKMTTDFSNPFAVEATEGGVFVNEFGEKMVEIPNRGQGFQWLLLNKQGNAQLLHKGEWISYEGHLEALFTGEVELALASGVDVEGRK